MKQKKTYSPVAAYSDLKQIEIAINDARTVDKLREIVVKDGPKVGYKAFCYILGQKMTPEAMKPDEACEHAAILTQQGREEEAREIYQKVVDAHPDHPQASDVVEK
jgi:tetratricopeptide (TPR) repeat protein